MHETIEDSKSDIIICGNKTINELGKITNVDIRQKKIEMSGIEGLKEILDEEI